MKSVIITAAILLTSQLSIAHGLHPVVANYLKGVEAASDYLGDNMSYSDADFNNLIGISTLQDLARKIRVIKFKFSAPTCAKDIEVYTKLDGSAVLSNKVVGCAP